jgi:hypothetical protein
MLLVAPQWLQNALLSLAVVATALLVVAVIETLARRRAAREKHDP